jgi:hypothetical protein
MSKRQRNVRFSESSEYRMSYWRSAALPGVITIPDVRRLATLRRTWSPEGRTLETSISDRPEATAREGGIGFGARGRSLSEPENSGNEA